MKEYKNSPFQVPPLSELNKTGIEVSFLENTDQLLYAIADGAGFGIYPAKYREVKAGFRRVPLIDQAPLEYGLLYHSARTPATEQLLRYLEAVLKDENQAI